MENKLNTYDVRDEHGELVNRFLSSSVPSLLNYLVETYDYRFEILGTEELITFVKCNDKPWTVTEIKEGK